MLRYAPDGARQGHPSAAGDAFGGDERPVKGAAGGRRASLAAMLVEMIHVASLIHDDVIDEADTRRGKPSVNARWQSHKAVILGDYILAKNMNIGLQSGQFDLVTHVCGSMAALCEGEVLQDECAAERSMTRRTYLDIISTRRRRACWASPRRRGRWPWGPRATRWRRCAASARRWAWPFRFRTTSWTIPLGADGQTRLQRPAGGEDHAAPADGARPRVGGDGPICWTDWPVVTRTTKRWSTCALRWSGRADSPPRPK